MIIVDERAEEQKKTATIGVVARDNFLSGWGQAEGGYSRCAWAAMPGADVDRLYRWVKARPEMKYVRIVDLSRYRPPKNTAHFHIYVAGPDHPSQR